VIGTDSFTFASQVDQAPIFVRKWEPPCGIRPQATVQITHGIAEHSGRYDRLPDSSQHRVASPTRAICAGMAGPRVPASWDRRGSPPGMT